MAKIINASKGLLPFKVLIIILTVIIIGIIALLIFLSRGNYLYLVAANIGSLLSKQLP